MKYYVLPLFLAAIALALVYLPSPTSQASHQPNSEIFMGVDMCPRDQVDSALAVAVDCADNNAFSAASGTMTLRTIEPCLALASWPQDSGDGSDVPVEVHLYVQNVSDLIGAQVRLNVDETKVKLDPASVDKPFAGRSFLSGPKDAFDNAAHTLNITTGVSGADTAAASHLLFSAYLGSQGAGVSADTPDTAPSIGASDSAPGYPAPGFESVASANTATGAGGIWLSFKLLRQPAFTSGVANIDLTASPAPASKVIRHTGFGLDATSIDLPEGQLFDGAIALGVACPTLSTPPAPSAPAADTDLPEATLATLTTPINCTPEDTLDAGTATARAQLWTCAVTNDSGSPGGGLALEFERTIPDASPQPAPLNQVHTQTPAGSWEVVDWYVNQPSHCDESLTNDSQLRLSFNSAVASGATATVKVETCFLIHAATLRVTKAGWTQATATPVATSTPPAGTGARATATATPRTGALAAPATGGPPGPNGNIWPWVFAVVGAVLVSAAVAALIRRPRRQG